MQEEMSRGLECWLVSERGRANELSVADGPAL